MIHKGMFIKHSKFMDVCIYLDKPVIKLPDGRYIIRGTFWNMGFIQSWYLGIKFNHKVTIKELNSDWYVTLMRPKDICLRNNPWVKIFIA